MTYIFYFMLCEIKNLFCFVFSTHAFMCLLKCFRNIHVDLVVLLSTLATDR